MELRVPGAPSGARPRTGSSFRERVAQHAATASGHRPPEGIVLAFTLRAGHWVDLDTITETALAGLRDAGVLSRGLVGLDAVLAIKATGPPGVVISTASAGAVARRALPGPILLDVAGPRIRAATRDAKGAWRDAVAAAWGTRPVPSGDVWAEVATGGDASLTSGLEPLLDVLEPVLGRDPRGRGWQEFFPNDDRIVWLRVCRGGPAGKVRLRLGSVEG